MSSIKAIETIYSGYKFRSRLEARWAVFMDSLGFSYDYEFEGYDLDGVWYLPDFWLGDLDSYVEIKPHRPQDPNIDVTEFIARYNLLARMLSDYSSKKVLLIEGSPWWDGYEISLFFPDVPPLYSLEKHIQFGECRRCHAIFLWRPHDMSFIFDPRIDVPDCRGCTERAPTASERLDVAFTKARQARF